MLFVIKNYVVINADFIYLSQIFELLMLSLQLRHSSHFCSNCRIKYYALLQGTIERSFYEIEQNCVRHIVCQ